MAALLRRTLVLLQHYSAFLKQYIIRKNIVADNSKRRANNYQHSFLKKIKAQRN
jgi:hypothetical protein